MPRITKIERTNKRNKLTTEQMYRRNKDRNISKRNRNGLVTKRNEHAAAFNGE